jgi:hypothetical protein
MNGDRKEHDILRPDAGDRVEGDGWLGNRLLCGDGSRLLGSGGSRLLLERSHCGNLG